MSQRWVVAFTAVWLGLGAIGVAQDRATVQMRDGSKFEGRIEELTANGELFVRVSQNDQRRVPVSSVALIDKVGGASGLPDTEVREATGSQHLLLLSERLEREGPAGGDPRRRGFGQREQPRTYVFRSSDGREQTLRSGAGVARLPRQVSVCRHRPAIRRTTSALDPGLDSRVRFACRRAADGCRPACAFVAAKCLRSTRAAKSSCPTTRSDRARPAGTSRMAPGSPLPSVNAGALIGRVGNSQPFGIGDQASVPMPFDGILFLAVNDDERADNAGDSSCRLNRTRR